jgi:pyrimidine operon attenuation protein/uracil phosphoribosyltransferase
MIVDKQPRQGERQLIMNAQEIQDCLNRLADEILAKHQNSGRLALIGVQRRGVYLAYRLNVILQQCLGHQVASGILDITLYRDDWTTLGARALVGRTALDFDVNGMDIVLVDDVLYTGRTIRAAMEALVDFGRPRKMELLALVDRGLRELPIHADYVGITLKTSPDERVDVLLHELDGVDEVDLRKQDLK